MTLPPSYARLFYPVQAGFTTRGMAKRGVLSLAHTYGLHVKVKEDKGLLTSLYRFVFVGEETRIRAFHTDLQSWARGVGAEIESPDLIEL